METNLNPNVSDDILRAQNPQALAKAVKNAGLTLGLKLSELLSKTSGRSVIRTGLAVITATLICVATYLSFVGSSFIFSYGGIFSGFFAFLDLVLLILVWRDIVSGPKVIAVLAMEFLTFIYFGYTINGYFGGGSLQGVAEKQVTDMYRVAGSTYGADAAALTKMVNGVKNDAVKIQQIEIDHDGIEGVVWQKAKLIADMKVDSIPAFPTAPSAPQFESLPEANQWLQSQADDLNKQNQEFQSSSNMLIQQAKGAAEGVREGTTSNLSQNQTSNMGSLRSVLERIGNYSLKTPEIKTKPITASDFQVDTFQKIMGYAIEGVIAVLLILLAFAFPLPKYSMEELRQEALDTITLKGLKKRKIAYNGPLNETATSILKKIETLMENEDGVFAAYIKSADINAVVAFAIKHPDALEVLPQAHANKWKFTDIEKMLEEEPDAEMYLEEILTVSRAKWRDVSVVVKPIAKAVSIAKEPAALKKFNEIAESLKRKLSLAKHEDLEHLLSQLLIEEPSLVYLNKLQVLCDKLPKNVLARIERSFVDAVSDKTVGSLIIQSEGQEFNSIMRDWTTDDNDKFEEILSNGVSKDAGFELLSDVVFINGVSGFRKMANCYSEKTKAARTTGMNAKVGISEAAMKKVDEAIKAQDKGKFYAALSEVFEIKGATI